MGGRQRERGWRVYAGIEDQVGGLGDVYGGGSDGRRDGEEEEGWGDVYGWGSRVVNC